MWAKQILLGVLGLSSGIVIAGGLFALIVELGVIADFADRTHTADRILLYEDCAALGGIAGNILSVFHPQAGLPAFLLPVFGLLAGMFVGCWAMALAEVLNVFPIFIRRLKIVRYTAAFIISMALGRGFGAGLYLFQRW
ncbi:MAG: stage V sporulation protein AB [Ruminococcus sp.]|nr:stage V sporulation protein AB [Ruminococcus sp.]